MLSFDSNLIDFFPRATIRNMLSIIPKSWCAFWTIYKQLLIASIFSIDVILFNGWVGCTILFCQLHHTDTGKAVFFILQSLMCAIIIGILWPKVRTRLFPHYTHYLIKSPRPGVTLCFQFVSSVRCVHVHVRVRRKNFSPSRQNRLS